jgi:phospholipase C
MRPVLLAIVLALAGCAGVVNSPPLQSSSENLSARRGLSGATGSDKITHVIYVVQEGRSFNNLFQGYPGADTQSSGPISTGKKIKLVPISLTERYEIATSAQAMFAACNSTGKVPGTSCRMNGFNKEAFHGHPDGVKYPMYSYVPHSESKPYFDIAHEWVVADRMFASQLDGTFTAHQYIVAAQAADAVNLPTSPLGCAAPPPGAQVHMITDRHRRVGPFETACFTYITLANELDTANLSWRFYTADKTTDSDFASSFQFDNSIYGTSQFRNDVISPPAEFLTDVAKGKLANVTWITPTCPDSDAADCGGGDGPSWVASVVNAVGQSKFWDSTAIFVQWDDWGGFFDYVPPPIVGLDGLGFRVPLLVISAYAKHNYVSHVQYETASVLRFTEDVFGLKQMAAADTRATSPAADCFDFSQPPRRFVPIKT